MLPPERPRVERFRVRVCSYGARALGGDSCQPVKRRDGRAAGSGIRHSR